MHVNFVGSYLKEQYEHAFCSCVIVDSGIDHLLPSCLSLARSELGSDLKQLQTGEMLFGLEATCA